MDRLHFVARRIVSYCVMGLVRARRLFLTGLMTAMLCFWPVFLSSILLSLVIEEAVGRRSLLVAAINGLGGATALFLVWLFWTLIWPLKRPWPIAFCLLSGIAMGLGVFGLHLLNYIPYFAEWHAPFFTITWAYQMFYTTASVIGGFSTRGFLYLLPLAWAAPLYASWRLHKVWQPLGSPH